MYYKNSWDEFIERNPHPSFERVIDQGYEVLYAVESPSCVYRALDIQVKHGKDVVAKADFVTDQNHEFGHCQNVFVESEHRRHGIATALYVFAELILGVKLENFWDNTKNQQEDAAKFWNRPNRPFGNVE
jgi:ribosomal protein S18 acetylase RimI-like enzyme